MNSISSNKQEDFFDKFPILETDRFILKELTDVYLPHIIEVMLEKETMEYSGMIIINPDKQAKMFLGKVKDMYESKKGIRWAIIDKTTGSYIGDIGYYNIEIYSKHTELGYTISNQYWRKGIATECINKLTEFALNEFGMNKIVLMIDDRNKKSINLANKIGFKHDGILREEHYLKDNDEYISMNIFSKLKREF